MGTPFYLAPEVLTNSSTSHTVDLWAFGVLLHELMVGSTPFTGSDRQQLFVAILKQPLNLQWNLVTSGKDANKRPGFQRTLSDSATFVLEGLLEKDPRSRLRASDLKRAAFFAKFFKHFAGSVHGLDNAAFLKKSVSPPFKPVHYNSEVNVKNLTPLLSARKKTLSSTCCGGPKYVPGFSFVRASSKKNISEEIDSPRESVKSGAPKKVDRPRPRSLHTPKNVGIHHDLRRLRRSSSEGAKSARRLRRSSSTSPTPPKHISSLGWDAVHSIF